jgi:hypothetical protein
LASILILRLRAPVIRKQRLACRQVLVSERLCSKIISFGSSF